MVTSHIGLVTTASTTYNEPYNLARRFATLDLISKGRAGWNVVASWSEHEAQNFGLETTLDYDTRYARSAEFVDVVKGLWDGWDYGALLLDKAGGRYFDEAKMHVLNHHGRFFKVRGPLSVACMPQGHPVIVQAGASEQGRELGAATADVIYAINGSLDAARAYYDDVKGRMAKYCREPDGLKIMPAFCPVLERRRAEHRQSSISCRSWSTPWPALVRSTAPLVIFQVFRSMVRCRRMRSASRGSAVSVPNSESG
jgi:FMN-dependent oxidoreductase (nitrilotriacetate monooxygenase family)